MLKNVSPGLIENVKDLKISLNELTVYDFDVYSSIEVYYKIAHKLNDIIRELSRFEGLVSDEVISQNNKLLYLLGEGLENEVKKEIDNLIQQNFFDDLVNVTLINKLNDRIDKIDSQLIHKANLNSVFNMSNMGQDIKEAMTGGSVAIVGENAILEENVVNGQITPIKTNFLEVGKNKFDGRYLNGAITTENGDVSTMKIQSDDNGIVVIIPITPNQTYTLRLHETSNRRRWGIMNSYPYFSSTPLKVDTPLYHNDVHVGKYTFTNTSNGKYFIAYLSSNGVTPKLQLEEGDIETEYEDYKINLKNSLSKQKILSIAEENSQNIAILDNIINYSFDVNMFNGVYIENMALITYPSSDICEYSKSDNCISAIIKINPNTTYTVKKFSSSNRFKIALSENPLTDNSNDLKLLIGDGDNTPINSNEFTFTTSSNDNYMVVYVSNSNEKPLLCVVKGETCEKFIQYGEYNIKGIDKILELNKNNPKYYFLDDINGVYKAPKTIEGGSINDSINLVDSKCSVIYNIYDELVVKYPGYVSKTELGTVSNDLKINQYIFSPLSIDNQSSYTMRKFKIILLSAIHGYEQGSAWCMANFLKHLCEDNTNDEILSFIKNNVELVVIPVANPYGFNNNTRCNANGIDLNRNFNANWSLTDAGSEYYGGESASSEGETKILEKVIDDNLDAEWVIDYHNIAGGYPLYYLYSDDQVRICNSVFRTLSKEWTNEYPSLPKNKLLGYCKTGVNACFAKYALKNGINSFVLETPWIMPVLGKNKYDEVTTITGIEVFANTLVAILKSYK